MGRIRRHSLRATFDGITYDGQKATQRITAKVELTFPLYSEDVENSANALVPYFREVVHGKELADTLNILEEIGQVDNSSLLK